MTDRSKISLSGAMALVQQKLKSNDDCSVAKPFSAVAPDLAAVARMHKIEQAAQADGSFVPAPPTRH